MAKANFAVAPNGKSAALAIDLRSRRPDTPNGIEFRIDGNRFGDPLSAQLFGEGLHFGFERLDPLFRTGSRGGLLNGLGDGLAGGKQARRESDGEDSRGAPGFREFQPSIETH